MKNKIYNYTIAALIGLLVLMTFACKKDLGNYEYINTGVPLIDTTHVAGTYAVPRYSGIKIEPGINFPVADTARLTYQWFLYKVIVGTTTEVPVSQLISTTRKLNTTIGNPIGPYKLELIVTDPKTNLKSNIQFNLNVTANINIGYGLLVLHTRNNTSDVDFLLTKNAVPTVTTNQWIKNIYSQAQGQAITGEPRFIASSRRAPTENWVTIGTSTHLTRVSGVDFTYMRENAEIFLRPGTVINPQAFVLSSTSFNDMVINDKKMHFINSTDPLGNIFPGAVTGSYSLAPFIAEASSSSIIGAVYDDQKLKFIHPISSNAMAEFRAPAATTQPFDLTNIGKTLIDMDRGFQSYTLSFFKDLSGTGRWLYVTNFNKADDGLMAIARYDMTALPDIANATIFRASEYGNVVYYATAHDIYVYNFDSSTAIPTFKGYAFPAGETITSMKIFKPKPNTSLQTTDGWVLYAATWDGNIGRVYEFGINPSGGSKMPELLNKFEGFGKVVDMTSKGGG
jgi:hypothetical protein